MDFKVTFQEIKELIRDFVTRRNWEKYHNPKDLAEAICVEASELLEVFQWTTAEEASSWRNDPSRLDSIRDELADVLIYCFSMANALKIDLSEAILRKLEKNERKYPAEKYFGRAR
jgi:dCTP diphosphatase